MQNDGYALLWYALHGRLYIASYKTGFVGKFGVKVHEGIADTMFNSNVPEWYPYFVEEDGK